MANCCCCGAVLRFQNTPMFHKGRLADDEAICSNCFRRINHYEPNMAAHLKRHTAADVNNFLKQKKQQQQRLAAIKSEIKGLDFSPSLREKEIHLLSETLNKDEKVKGIVMGDFVDKRGFLAATDRRLIFLKYAPAQCSSVELFSYDDCSVFLNEGEKSKSNISVIGHSTDISLNNVATDKAIKFVKLVRQQQSSNCTSTENADLSVKVTISVVRKGK